MHGYELIIGWYIYMCVCVCVHIGAKTYLRGYVKCVYDRRCFVRKRVSKL